VLAAGSVPIAITSDRGGIVRIPAALCEPVWLKPTREAIGPNVLPRWTEMSTEGVTASTVAAIVLQGEVIAGAAPDDWLSSPPAIRQLTPT